MWYQFLQGMEDPTFIHQYHMLPFDNSFDGFNFDSFSSESNSSYPSFSPETTPNFCGSTFQTGVGRQTKQFKTNSWESCTTKPITSRAPSSSTVQLISFGNSNLPPPTDTQKFHGYPDNKVKPKDEDGSNRNMKFASLISEGSYENQNYSPKSGDRTKRVSSTCRTNNHDHVIAERKRRGKLTQRFIALSALVPGLRKVLSVVKVGFFFFLCISFRHYSVEDGFRLISRFCATFLVQYMVNVSPSGNTNSEIPYKQTIKKNSTVVVIVSAICLMGSL